MVIEDTPAIAPWGKWDRAALQLLFGFGAVYAAAVLVIGSITIISEVVTGERLLSISVNEPLPEADAQATATLIDGGMDTARVFVADLSSQASTLLTAGEIIMVVTHLLVALSFLYLTWRLLRREPFLRSLTWAFVAAGAILIFGSLVGQLLTSSAANLVAAELGFVDETAQPWPFPLVLDMAPFALGFMLLLVGSAFEYAQKLSAETRGLV